MTSSQDSVSIPTVVVGAGDVDIAVLPEGSLPQPANARTSAITAEMTLFTLRDAMSRPPPRPR